MIRSKIASDNVASLMLSYQPCVSNCEQNIVETVWCLASTISSKSLASFPFSEVSVT